MQGTTGFLRATSAGRVVLGLLVLVALSLPARALADKYASLIVDADTGRVLHAVNADERKYPASLTKMMTLYLLFERLEQKKLRMTDRLTVTPRASRQPPSRLGLAAGRTISVEDAIQALVIKSANDIAATVADNLAGGDEQFALRMTATARDLGMDQTTFRNSSGLPHRSQMTTARDMATLAQALLARFPQYFHYFSRTSFDFAGQTHDTHNRLVESYPGGDGFKTGYIAASGFNLVFSAKRHGRRLIGVVFGGNTSRARDQLMADLMDRGFEQVLGPTRAAQAETPAPKPQPQPRTVARAEPRQEETAPLPPGRRWGVQVGAFTDMDMARRKATEAIDKASKHLADGTVFIAPLRKRGNRELYRARIVGLGKHDAYAACKVLERRRFDCMELKVPEGFEIASAGN